MVSISKTDFQGVHFIAVSRSPETYALSAAADFTS
jgi:hypothetical protein